MDDLVQRLAAGKHPITLGGPRRSKEELQKRIEDIGYVFVKFTDTQGGTDLGVRVYRQATDLSHANFQQYTGVAHIEGTLTLNEVNVRCVADLELETLNGTGYLVVLAEAL